MITLPPSRCPLVWGLLALIAAGCGADTTVVTGMDNGPPRTDLGGGTPELGVPSDGGTDAAADSGTDAGTEVVDDGGAGLDASAVDAGSTLDAGFDAGTSVMDAGFDAGTSVVDAGFDAGVLDGGFPTSIACPGWLGLPAGGVLLPAISPEGVRVGPDCALYVALVNTVYRIAEGTGTVTAFASNAAATDLQGLEFGPDGNLYVAERGSSSVVRFDGTTGAFIDVFAASGCSGPNTPRFGPDGRLYVSCRNSTTVVRYEPDGTPLGTFATHVSLDSPEGISFGPDGHLYVSARTNSVIMRFHGSTGAFMDQIAVSPTVSAPEGLGFGPDGSLWAASRDTGSVLRFQAGTFAVLETITTQPEGRPIGLEVVDGHVVVGIRETGRVLIVSEP